MRKTILLIAALAMVGCGKKTTPAEPETNAEPKVAAEKQEPPKTEPKAVAKIPANAIVNTLGMKQRGEKEMGNRVWENGW